MNNPSDNNNADNEKKRKITDENKPKVKRAYKTKAEEKREKKAEEKKEKKEAKKRKIEEEKKLRDDKKEAKKRKIEALASAATKIRDDKIAVRKIRDDKFAVASAARKIRDEKMALASTATKIRDDKIAVALAARKIRDDKIAVALAARKIRDDKIAVALAATKIRDDNKIAVALAAKKIRDDNKLAVAMAATKIRVDKIAVVLAARKIRDDNKLALALAARKIRDDNKLAVTLAAKKTRDDNKLAVALAAKKIRDDNKLAVALAAKKTRDDNKLAVALAAKKIRDDKKAETERKRAEKEKIRDDKKAETERKRAEKEKKPGRGNYWDTLTVKQMTQAKAKSEAAPVDYEERKKMLRRADVTYKKTGVFYDKDYCISSPSPPVNSMLTDLSAFSFSKDGDTIATFPRMNGTRVLMSAPTRGSCKLHGRSWGDMQTQHSATSGRYDSVVLIGMVKADDCTKADDKLKKHGITNTRVGEVLKYWHANARDSAKIMKFYKDETKLEYQPLGIYKGNKDGWVKIGIAQNLQPQYRKRMEQEISTDYYEVNKVEVYAPELASLLEASMGSPRIHFYPAGTGAMGAHYDSYHNTYDDIRQQKYSILFDMKDYKHN